MANTMEDLTKGEGRIARFAKRTIEEGKEFHPMMEVTDSKGNITVLILLGIFDPDMRDQKRCLLKDILKKHDAVSYLIASEAWSLELHHDAFKTLRTSDNGTPILERPIRDDDRRKSILIVHGENTNGDMVFSVRDIDENTDPRTLSEPRVAQKFTRYSPDRLVGEHVGLLEEERGTLQ